MRKLIILSNSSLKLSLINPLEVSLFSTAFVQWAHINKSEGKISFAYSIDVSFRKLALSQNGFILNEVQANHFHASFLNRPK